ncbi:glutamine amidotransferase [Nonlabens sp. Hel1_33_55]|uniref:imidazole glycerol phosphate synthase subunit HisH n=1 Tax=Nonlabens sp. Hel1_33_55 TaxID=1336802 RepID=UPI000875BFD7|nr:imidazole glycerol phosphate synthase subunit HisH [Nonlabens sp. Hel1_33_55]SCY23098.1 glutamine amidotransferase [Nonlabens sp. Hel1_33_55]
MIAIVKYNAGNIGSVTNALNRLGIENKVTDDPAELKAAHKVIFPGVGEAGTAMKYLRERELDQVLINLKKPFLGICLGMQLMCNHSEEGDTKCLGIFDTDVKLFQSKDFKVPHMGWNSLSYELGVQNSESLLTNIERNSDVYYVHSYYAEVCDDTAAVCDYLLPFSSVLQKNNFYATQFHPEKSAGVGEQLLKNFIGLP